MKWTTEHVTTDRPLTSNTDAQWRNGDAPDFWVWHLSSVRLKLWLPFPLGCIKSCMCTAKFICVFSFSFMVYGNLATILFYLWLHWWRARKCNRAFLFIQNAIVLKARKDPFWLPTHTKALLCIIEVSCVNAS